MNIITQKKLAAFMTLIQQTAQRIIRTVTGIPPLTLTDCGGELVSMEIDGNSAQNGTPTPDAPVEVESVGERTANLFKLPDSDSNTVIVLKTGLQVKNDTRCTINANLPDLKPGVAYTCAYRTEGTSNAGSSGQLILTDGRNHVYLGYAKAVDEHIRTFTLSEGINYNQIWVYGKNFKYQDIRIFEGSYTAATIPPYEPYGYKIPVTVSRNGTTTTTNIYIAEPLRGIGEYKDSIVAGKNADTIVINRSIAKIAASYVNSVYRRLSNVVRFGVIGPGSEALKIDKNNGSLCDKLPLKAAAGCWTANDERYFWHKEFNTYPRHFFISLNKDRFDYNDEDTDQELIAKAKAYLAEHPLTIYYPCVETETDITALNPDIPELFEGTVVVDVDTTVTPSGMTVEYYESEASA